MWCDNDQTRCWPAKCMLLCYQPPPAQCFLSICASKAAGSAIDVWHYHYYYHYEYYALCSPNLYYVIPDLIMPNCSCIRLSTLQSQHQTYRHSSTNQTLATFTFNILTFISTIYISLQTTSQHRQQPPTKLCRHFADPLSTLHWHCCSLFLVTMPCLSNFLTLCLQSKRWCCCVLSV